MAAFFMMAILDGAAATSPGGGCSASGTFGLQLGIGIGL